MDKHKAEDVTRRLVRFRNISVLLAWLVMPLPFVVYFTNNQSVMLQYSYHAPTANLIWVMILANLLAYVAVSLWTIQIAKQAVFDNNLQASIRDRFINRPVMGRWWNAIEQTWLWNVLGAMPRVGLVIGIAQYFFTSVDGECVKLGYLKIFFQPYCFYASYYGNDLLNFDILLGCSILFVFSISNCGYLCALAQNHLIRFASMPLRSIFAHRIKIGYLFVVMIIIFEIIFVMSMRSITDEGGVDFCQKSFPIPYGTCWQEKRITANERTNFGFTKVYDWVETLEIITWSFLDNGVMLASKAVRIQGYPPTRLTQTTNNEFVYLPIPEKEIDYLQRLSTQLLLAFISVSLMALQTYQYLRRMERLDSGGHAHGQA